jgi:hypothetical protein
VATPKDVFRKARERAGSLYNGSRPSIKYYDDNSSINGWAFHLIRSITSPQGTKPKDYDEYALSEMLVLGTNGKIYLYTEEFYVRRGGKRVDSRTLQPASPTFLRSLHGRQDYEALDDVLRDDANF